MTAEIYRGVDAILAMVKKVYGTPVSWDTMRRWRKEHGCPISYDHTSKPVLREEDFLAWHREREGAMN